MRILCLTPWFPNAPGEREGNYIFDSVMALRDQGVEVKVLLVRAWKPWQRHVPNYPAFPADLDLHLVHYPRIPRNYLQWLSNRLLFSRVYRAIVKYSRLHEVQLIHAHTEAMAEVAAAAAKALEIRSIVTIHGINTSHRYLGTGAQKKHFKNALNACGRVVLVGEPLRTFFSNITKRDDHFRVVHNGFRISCSSEGRQICTGLIKRLISVSNLHEGKGIDLTIRALARLKLNNINNWSYCIIGDGDKRSELERLVQDIGLQEQVTFFGAVEHAEVPAHLNRADIFVLPSYREAFGIAYLEAMACGLLTIGVEGQGAAEFISHEQNGLLTRGRDIDNLAITIRFALENTAAVRKMAAAGRVTARRDFSWSNHARALHSVYCELLPKRLQS